MKLLRLEILNLASLDRQGGEVIDFETGVLGKSTIFSIVGPTGSGKSTLLDAICLALYNRAPRYPRMKGKRGKIEIYGEVDNDEKNRLAPTDGRNILTRGKKDGYSKLTFLANNGNVYRAEWHVHFKLKDYTDAETYLYKITSENGTVREETGKWDDIPEIVGLDYDQFLNTVLIAQGDFAKFLTASENDRYELLEKLIGCEEQYTTIANNIKNEKTQASNEYISIKTSYSTYDNDIIKQPELDEVTERIKVLENEEANIKKEVAAVDKSLEWYDSEDKFLKSIADGNAAVQEAKEALAANSDAANRLGLHDLTIDAVRHLGNMRTNMANISKQDEELRQLENQRNKKNEEIKLQNEELLKLKKEAESAQQNIDNQRPHINRARELKGELKLATDLLDEKIKGRQSAEEALGKASEALRKNGEAVAKAQKSKIEKEEALGKLNEEISKKKEENQNDVDIATALFQSKEAEGKGVDPDALQAALSGANRRQVDINELIRIGEERDKKRATIDSDQKKAEQLKTRNNEIDSIMPQKGKDLEILDNELATLNKSYTLMTSEDWNRHRADLAEGDPCPLCGSVHHPYKSDATLAPVVSDMKTMIDEKTTKRNNLNNEIQTLVSEKSGNVGQIQSLSENVGNIEKELGLLGKKWTEIKSNYPEWPEEVDALRQMKGAVDKAVADANEALAKYNALSKDIERLRKNKDTAVAAQRKYNEESADRLNEATSKLNEVVTTLKTEVGKTQNLKEQLEEKQNLLNDSRDQANKAQTEVDNKKKSILDEVGDKDPEELEKQLEKTKNESDNLVKNQIDHIGRLNNELGTIKGKLESTSKAKLEEEKKKVDNEQMLSQWLEQYNASHDGQSRLTVDDIIAISDYTDNWEVLRQYLNSLKSKLTAVEATLQKTNGDHLKHQETKPEADRESLQIRKTELERHTNKELVELKVRRERHDNAQKQMGSLYAQLQAAEKRNQDWTEIVEAIGADGKTLRKIAQCYTLSFLIAHANAEIRKFNSRYELQQVKNSLGIRVIDHDRADDVRDITSLSGGETFIVSLGLALGLSSLSSRNISFENLFIDEGFGTLDPDTLATVINSLSMLQTSQNKKVGVISHTNTMSELITTQIRVIKKGSSGSSHIEIYP